MEHWEILPEFLYFAQKRLEAQALYYLLQRYYSPVPEMVR